ncbi:hypothetical protein [Brevibacterium sp.]|uniref:hypothetical protein n=1 Tax=Brevibacterium sp. TaxID=1701 RepID=UPI002811704F|nr:hypothetical protein [Brevibacterium sp.]
MPPTHELCRTAAALGTILALLVLSQFGISTPANAIYLHPPTETSSNSTAAVTADASSGDDGSASSSPDTSAEADAGSGDSSSAEADGAEASAGADSANADDSTEDGADGSKDPTEDPTEDPDPSEECSLESDPNCKPSPASDVPAAWGADQTLRLSDVPDSWVGQTFSGPSNDGTIRVPAQNASKTDTDDSGNPVAASSAPAPEKYSLDSNGYVVDAANRDEPMKFEGFDNDPGWKFNSNGETISVTGEPYTGSDTGSDPDASSTGNDTGTETGESDSTSTDGTADANTADSSGTDTAGADSADSDASGSTSSSDPDSTSTADSTDSADSSASSDITSAQDATDDRSDGTPTPTPTDDAGKSGTPSSPGSDPGTEASSSSGSDDGSGEGGTGGGDQSVPDPSTGNGSVDTRDTIPGDIGADWVPAGDGPAQRPDYSDPVPSNPDTSMPNDETDLITGGSQPAPRANTPPSPSFGESIVSTLVSSWPVFVLAAFGMAAVGFIIYLVGRRGSKQA